MKNKEISQLFKDAKDDTELLSTIDIDDLLKAVNKGNTDYLENKTIHSISDEIYNTINTIDAPDEKKQLWCKSLIGYRLVDDVYELHKGKLVKTICLYDDRPPKMLFNGIVMNITFSNNGTMVLCRSPSFHMFCYNFNKCITFQKLSDDEQLILTAYEYIQTQTPAQK